MLLLWFLASQRISCFFFIFSFSIPSFAFAFIADSRFGERIVTNHLDSLMINFFDVLQIRYPSGSEMKSKIPSPPARPDLPIRARTFQKNIWNVIIDHIPYKLSISNSLVQAISVATSTRTCPSFKIAAKACRWFLLFLHEIAADLILSHSLNIDQSIRHRGLFWQTRAPLIHFLIFKKWSNKSFSTP